MISLKQLLILFTSVYIAAVTYLYASLKCKEPDDEIQPPPQPDLPQTNLTVAIVDFDFDADHKLHQLEHTIGGICQHLLNVIIVIFSHTPIYPPLDFSNLNSSCKVVERTEENYQVKSYAANQLQNYIKSNYIFFIPDMIDVKQNIGTFLWSHLPLVDNEISVMSFDPSFECSSIEFSSVTWTLKFTGKNECEYLNGTSHGFLMRKETFLSLPHPLLRPFAQSLFLQAKSTGLKLTVYNASEYLNYSQKSFQMSSPRLSYLQHEYHNLMYEELGIKRIIDSNGSVKMLGCKREESRCFPTIINDMPSFLYQGKWTPPCCLEHLKETARHVFRVLDIYNIRYWLEGGSLLGAMRNGDIIPWDTDVDIGVYQEDLDKLFIFSDARTKGPVMDELGYVWEASEQQSTAGVSVNNYLYRVHYSASNRIHVDIFPFYSLNGTMTKDYWFSSHRQDMPFPESFLKPMTKVPFIGVQVSAPNHAINFLHLKFGPDALDTYKLPDGSAVTVP